VPSLIGPLAVELEPKDPRADDVCINVARSSSGGARRARSRPVRQQDAHQELRIVFAPLRDVRRALTVEGDVASDIAFQNDVNSLLATISGLSPVGREPPLGSRPRRARGRR